MSFMQKYISAKCSFNNNIYKLTELSRLKNGNPILDSLVCVYCGCPLTFHHARRRSAYLSAKPGHKHSTNCIHHADIEAKKLIKKSTVTITVLLTREMQHDRAVSGYKALLNKLNPNISAKSKTNHNKKQTLKRADKKTKRQNRTRFIPTTTKRSNQASSKVYKGIRTPFVTPANYFRFVNQAVKCGGFLTDVHVGRISYLQFKLNETSMKIYLNEAFFRNCSVGFKDILKGLAKELSKLNKAPIVYAVAEVVPDKQTLHGAMCLVRFEDSILINGKSVRMFLHSL